MDQRMNETMHGNRQERREQKGGEKSKGKGRKESDIWLHVFKFFAILVREFVHH